VSQVIEQAPATQAATPFGSDGHAVHEAPQAAALSSCAQVVPHAWKPVLHTNPHFVPSHVACDAPGGTGHTVHDGPQPVTSPIDRHSPLQACVPVGHSPEQGVPCATHAPLHKVFPAGHEPPHEVPSQVAVPPCGTGQGVHALPQLLVSSFRTQIPPHRCCPDGQAGVMGTSGGASTRPPAPPLPARGASKRIASPEPASIPPLPPVDPAASGMVAPPDPPVEVPEPASGPVPFFQQVLVLGAQ
jgi:hypothetical protein